VKISSFKVTRGKLLLEQENTFIYGYFLKEKIENLGLFRAISAVFLRKIVTIFQRSLLNG